MNVLIAADILVKDNKVVYYSTFFDHHHTFNQPNYHPKPNNIGSFDSRKESLRKELDRKREDVAKKKADLLSLMKKGFAVEDVIARNRKDPTSNSFFVSLPFILVSPTSSQDKQV